MALWIASILWFSSCTMSSVSAIALINIYRGEQERRSNANSKSTSRAVTATFRCHLLARPPPTVTSCCQQWLGCNACAVSCPANRCPLCNAQWDDSPRIVIRGLDNLTTIAQAVRRDLGTQHTHSFGSDDSDFRPHQRTFRRPLRPRSTLTTGSQSQVAAATTATTTGRATATPTGATGGNTAASDEESPELIEYNS